MEIKIKRTIHQFPLGVTDISQTVNIIPIIIHQEQEGLKLTITCRLICMEVISIHTSLVEPDNLVWSMKVGQAVERRWFKRDRSMSRR